MTPIRTTLVTAYYDYQRTQAMRLTKQWVSALGAVLLALSAVSVQAETPKHGGTLVVTIGTTPTHLNPAVQSGIATVEPGAQSFATLVRFDD